MKVKRLMAAMGLAAVSVASTGALAAVDPALPSYTKTSGVSGNLSSVGAELTTGDRGDAAQVNAEYRIQPDHTVYGSYTYSTDRTDYDPLFNNRLNSGWTLGQRWRLSNQVNMFNESQFLKAPNMIHDTHRLGHDHRAPSLLERVAPTIAARVYSASLHRLRLDDRIDVAFSPVMALAALIDRADQWLRRTLSLDRRDA